MEVVPVLGLPPLRAYAYILIVDPGQWSPVPVRMKDQDSSYFSSVTLWVTERFYWCLKPRNSRTFEVKFFLFF